MIDWILAEKIAGYVAGTGDAPTPKADLNALAAESQRRVTAYTGLHPTRPLPPPEGVQRREWVQTNIKAMRQLLDPVLDRAGGKLSGPLKPAMQLTLGFVVTTEVAVVLGYLAQRVLGQYELVLLDESTETTPPRLLFVLPNLGQAVRSFEAPEDEFMTWVALHEVTHAVQFSGVPWLHGYVAGLVKELLGKAELRMDTERKLHLPSRAEIKRVVTTLRNGDLVTLFTSQAERETFDRVQAVMAVIEGHAEHVMDAVAPDLLPSLPQLRQALNRRRTQQSGLSRMFAKLLGLELKLRQYEQGKAFCDAVVERVGTEGLQHVFSGPDALPTLQELNDAPAWLRRVGLDGALPEAAA
jgi:coenzyme F420 biosynthesis associated uncharacterized protein